MIYDDLASSPTIEKLTAYLVRDTLARAIDTFHLPGQHEQQDHSGGDFAARFDKQTGVGGLSDFDRSIAHASVGVALKFASKIGKVSGVAMYGSFVQKKMLGKVPKDIDVFLRVGDISKFENQSSNSLRVGEFEVDVFLTDGKKTLVPVQTNKSGRVRFVRKQGIRIPDFVDLPSDFSAKFGIDTFHLPGQHEQADHAPAGEGRLSSAHSWAHKARSEFAANKDKYEIHRISISGGWKSEHLDALQQAGYAVYSDPRNPVGLKYAVGIIGKRAFADTIDFTPKLRGAKIKEVRSVPTKMPRKGNPTIGLVALFKNVGAKIGGAEEKFHLPGEHDQSAHAGTGGGRAVQNWKRPDATSLKREFHVEQTIKGHKFWKDESEFLRAVDAARVETITPQADDAIANRSGTTTRAGLLSLIKGYKSYPKYRNEKTLDNLYDRIGRDLSMDLPLVVERADGSRRVFAGNTRMDIAFQLGKNPQVLIVKTGVGTDKFHLPDQHDQQSHAGGRSGGYQESELPHDEIKIDDFQKERIENDLYMPHLADAEAQADALLRNYNYDYTKVRRVAMDAWTEGSEGMRAKFLEGAASEIWGGEIRENYNKYTPDEVFEEPDPEVDPEDAEESRRAYNKIVRAQYAVTQSHIKKVHKSGYVTLFRAVRNSSGELGTGDIRIETDALSSWTLSPRTALKFTKNTGKARRLMIRVPVEDIFAAPFSSRGLLEYGEHEYILIGRGERRQVRSFTYDEFAKIFEGQQKESNSVSIALGEKFQDLVSELERFAFHRAYGGALYETRTNQYEAELIRIYERWTTETAKRFLRAANTTARNAVIEDAAIELEEELVNAGRKGLLEAMQLGAGDNELSPRGYEKLAEAMQDNEQYIVSSLLPAIRIRLQMALNDDQFLRGGETAIKGLLQSYNGRVGSYAGAYWRAIFVGVGDALSGEQDTRRVEWELDPAAEHCEDCVRNAGIYDSFDSMELGVGLPSERVRCRANCRCIVKIETEPGSGKFERMSDMAWFADLFHLPGQHEQQDHAGGASSVKLKNSTTLYHVTGGANIGSILKRGLLRSTKTKDLTMQMGTEGYEVDGVFLANLDQAQAILRQLQDEDQSAQILEVYLPKGTTVYKDRLMPESSIVVAGDIPKARIRKFSPDARHKEKDTNFEDWFPVT